MSPLTQLSFKTFPNGTAFDVIFIQSPIFNRNVVNGVLNMIWWKYSIIATYSMKGGIDTTNLPQRIICRWECIPGFIVNYHPPPYNNDVMITSMCSYHRNDARLFHHPQNINSNLQVLKVFILECTCSAELEYFAKNPQIILDRITFSTRL